MKVKVILNPYANRWRAGEHADAILEACAAAGLECDLSVTQQPAAGIELATAAAGAGYEAVVAAGGDGSINEVINGLVRATAAGPTHPFGVIPLGTANDFSDMVGLPRDLTSCIAIIASGRTRQVDAGRITIADGDHYFINNSAVAMEPMVTLENIRMTRLSGEIRYMVALLKTLLRLSAWEMEIEWDGGGYQGPTYLLSLCNSPRTGGFYMAPDALVDDALLDFVFAPKVPRRTVFAILGRLLRGNHVSHAAVTAGKTSRLSLVSAPGTPIHADGEIIAESVTQVDFEVLPGKVTLLVP